MADITILKIIKLPYLNKKSPDFDDIWYTTAHLEAKFKVADDCHI